MIPPDKGALMLLAVDAGNTETMIGLDDGQAFVHHWRLTSHSTQTGDELGVLLHSLLQSVNVDTGSITGLAVSSVVPELIPAYRAAGRRLLDQEALIIDHRAVPYLRIRNLDPASVGADRLVNAVAVSEEYGTPSIVVDLGTATTLDVIGEEGDYVGGLIAPGITTGADALFRAGARLARVEIKPPIRVVGRTTEESMQSGIFYGAVGAVDTMVREVIRENAFPADLPVVATGGLAGVIQPASQTVTAVDSILTLKGIRLVWQRHPAGS